MDICSDESVAHNNFATLFLHIDMIENKPSAQRKRTDSVPSCVSNMKEQRYAANVRGTTQNESAEKPEAVQGAGGNTVTQTERDRDMEGRGALREEVW